MLGRTRFGATTRRYDHLSPVLDDPSQLNPTFNADVFKGRNAAPTKSDDSVLSTIPELKVRAESEPVDAVAQQPPVEASDDKKYTQRDRHSDMKKRGLEKKRLLAALAPPAPAKISSEPVRSEVKLSKPSKIEMDSESVPKKQKHVSLFKEVGALKEVKTTLDPSKSMDVKTVHSEKKRKKMRERERLQREKLRSKKNAKAEKRNQKRIGNKPRFNETIEKPSELIRELGSKLAEKLGKEKRTLLSAYDKIQVRKDIA